MFINLKDKVLTVNPYRFAYAMSCGIADMLNAIDSKSGESLVIAVEGVADALQDGEFLDAINASISAVEELHAVCP